MKQMKLNTEYLPKNDLVFTVMFLEKNLCEKTLNAILGEEVHLIDVVAEAKNDLHKAALNSVYFDILTRDISGRILTLDLQRKYVKDRIRSRTVYYACREIAAQEVQRGEYEKLKNVVVTFLLTEAPLKHTSAGSEIQLQDCLTGEKYSDLLSIYEINIKHIDEKKSLELNILKAFFEISTQDDFDCFIETYGSFEYGKLLLNNYLSAVNNNSLLNELGKESKYMIKLSDEERIEIKLEGIKEGQHEMALQIAKKMILNGIDDKFIMETTNLQKEEIDSLKG